jgi:hypothetical protein
MRNRQTRQGGPLKVLAYYPKLLRYLRPYWRVAAASVAGRCCLSGQPRRRGPKILADRRSAMSRCRNPPRSGTPALDKFTMLVLTASAGFAIALLSGLLNVATIY